VRPGYKHTEVGVIPNNWDVKPFFEIGKLTKGKGLLKQDIKRSGSVPAIPYTALYTDFSELLEYERIKWFVDDVAQTVVVREPCLLLASSSNMEANTGKACALLGTTSVAIGREIIIFKTPSDCAFISYLLSTSNYRKKTLRLARGTTIKHVYPATFLSYQIAHPPLSEQRAISQALSDVDVLITALDRLIAKKRDIKQATMQQLLTGRTRLPGFSGKWEVKQLGDVVQIKKGQLITSSTLKQGDIPVIAGGKQPAYYHASANRFGRTITISASGASAGYVALYNYPIFASDCSTISESGSYSLDFIYYQLLSMQQTIYKSQTGGAQPHIHAKDLTPLKALVPSMPEQVAIAAVLSDMDAELSALEARRDKTRDLKQGMMQELLTGKTRLI
jgi:type I restriction enzyme S subunit